MNVGDYVRTIKGNIYKLKEEDLMFEMTKQNCKISSSNIIDLIEVGDYVNGWQVIEHAHEKGRLFVPYVYVGGKGFTTYEDYSWELTKENEDRIETIITKEQFESMEYKL